MATQSGSIKEYDAERNGEIKLLEGEHQPLQPKNDPQSSASWWLTQAIIVTIFVVFGAVHALAARISVDANGEIPYNTGAVVALAEFTKLFVSVIWVLAVNRHDLLWPWPYSWKLESLYLGTIAALFAAQNQMNFSVIANLGAALYAILGNLKIVWTCVFMRILMDKRFSKWQWTAVALLTASSIVIEIPSSGGDSRGRAPLIGLILILISTLCSGIASVQNEMVLKRKQQANDGDEAEMPFMLKNAVLYVWGVIMNVTTWGFSHGNESFFKGFNAAAVFAMLALVGVGLSCACVLKYLDNMVRCFAGVFTVFATLLASRLMPAQYWEDPFSIYHVLSLLMLSVALVMYSSYTSPNMWYLVCISAISAVVVGALCMLLDQLLQTHHG